MTDQQVTASGADRALRELYPGEDVKVRHEPGGIRASVFSEDGSGLHVSVGDQPGILSAWLGLDPSGPRGDGGEELNIRQSA